MRPTPQTADSERPQARNTTPAEASGAPRPGYARSHRDPPRKSARAPRALPVNQAAAKPAATSACDRPDPPEATSQTPPGNVASRSHACLDAGRKCHRPPKAHCPFDVRRPPSPAPVAVGCEQSHPRSQTTFLYRRDRRSSNTRRRAEARSRTFHTATSRQSWDQTTSPSSRSAQRQWMPC